MQKVSINQALSEGNTNENVRIVSKDSITSLLADVIQNKLSQANLRSKFSIDIIISENMCQKVLFKFGTGIPTSNIAGWFSRFILADTNVLRLISNAEIDEIVFWDDEANNSQSIQIQDLLHLSRA